jgi:hypothetical protein
MNDVSDRAIAYYPGETPVFEGELSVVQRALSDNDTGLPTADVVVHDDESLNIAMTWKVENPVRTQYAGYFLRRVGKMMVCNVDLELAEQPPLETVAGVLLAAMIPELSQ